MRTVFKPVLVGFLMLIPALSQAEISVSCGFINKNKEAQSLGVTVNENATSNFVTVKEGSIGQGAFTSSIVENVNGVMMIRLENENEDSMGVMSAVFDKNVAGTHLGQAMISVGSIQAKYVPCHIIVK